jgi:Bacterial mobilisation protein (MobC)
MTRKPSQGRPGGRPRKDDPSLRTEWLRARVTTAEKHRAEQLARDAGKTSSEYVRDTALTAHILIKRSRNVSPTLLHELSRIGNNLNQIAKICNTTGESRRAQGIEIYLDELRPMLKRLYELQ